MNLPKRNQFYLESKPDTNDDEIFKDIPNVNSLSPHFINEPINEDLNMQNHKITNLSDPINELDSVNKKYVDDALKTELTKAKQEIKVLADEIIRIKQNFIPLLKPSTIIHTIMSKSDKLKHKIDGDLYVLAIFKAINNQWVQVTSPFDVGMEDYEIVNYSSSLNVISPPDHIGKRTKV